MLNTTLCYISRGSEYLMLHRVKKKNDINHDKWIGIGGKFEADESPDECLLREAREETGLTLTSWRCRGIVTFVNTKCESEYMHLFTADGFEGEIRTCGEGDKIFLRLLENDDEPFFLLKLGYDGDELVSAVLNGTKIV